MKALSIKQPYASLIALGKKKEEFRSWNTPHRGALLIVASQKVDLDACEEHDLDPSTFPRGVAICVATLVSVRATDGDYAFKLREPQLVKHYLPAVLGVGDNARAQASARLHLYEVSDALVKRALAKPDPCLQPAKKPRAEPTGPGRREPGWAVRIDGGPMTTVHDSSSAFRAALAAARRGLVTDVFFQGVFSQRIDHTHATPAVR